MAKYKSLKAILKDADEKVKQAAVKALNDSSEEVQNSIKSNMDKVGIVERTGTLKRSVTVIPATTKTFKAVISSEVFKPAPKNPGKRNPEMKNRYKYGTPYGRIIEFSPRINKPFFYTAWYKERKRISEEIIRKIGEAWK